MNETTAKEEKCINESARHTKDDTHPDSKEATSRDDIQEEEGEEEEGEEEEGEEEEEELEHPIDSLAGVIEEIDNQLTRMVKRNRNPTNLKNELVNNVYPLLRQGFQAIIDWMSAIEGSDDDDEQTEIEEMQNLQKEMFKEFETNIQNCELLISIEETIKKALLSADREKFEEIISWAKLMIETSKQLLERKDQIICKTNSTQSRN